MNVRVLVPLPDFSGLVFPLAVVAREPNVALKISGLGVRGEAAGVGLEVGGVHSSAGTSQRTPYW